ncbi:MAG TPA: 2-dehydro-3-deoxygalactonokinase [Arenibaculum sp.]|nr:2-dehydro-3-deoxygalactonokinase [Arenibaculum sp.]
MNGCIGIDWGSSNLRAYEMAADGTVLERRSSAAGALRDRAGGFEAALREVVGDWLAAGPGLPVVLSGMVGSRQGWMEVPYAGCPAGIEDIARGILFHDLGDGTRLAFVPGLVVHPPGGPPDVMRGEEVQLLGTGRDGLHCLPGTHSKWALVRDGRIERFGTHMTGETFELLTRHGVLGRLMDLDAPRDPDAFARGLDRAREPGGLLHHLFSARTLGLFGELVGGLGPAALPSYLSGLLIGHEILGQISLEPPVEPVVLVGSPALTRAYGDALSSFGIASVEAPGDAAAIGLFRLARIAFNRGSSP